MTQAVKLLQIVAKLAEFIGAAVAAVLAIIAGGQLNTSTGKAALVSAFVAGIGHATTHTTEGTT